MIPNPIRKVLSAFCMNGVQSLLMGGQACILYGAAEFSRDSDFAILADARNLENIQRALDSLDASVIALPPFELEYLRRGHAVHFRCMHADVRGMRIDIMSKMRGVAQFPDLWARRTSADLGAGLVVEVMSLRDLVTAKKTQRDKDWLMLRRLLEADFFGCKKPDAANIRFWLLEMRTASLLLDIAKRFPSEAASVAGSRAAVNMALRGDMGLVEQALRDEEAIERKLDFEYWAPLREELECMRHGLLQDRGLK